MNEKKKYASGVNVGSSSILVTFVLLCLVTFAALAFVSANSDYTLSRQAAERTTDYYNANHIAEVFLLNIESQIRNTINNTSSEEEFYNSIEDTFSDNNSISVEIIDNENIQFSYNVAISDKQILDIVLATNYNSFKNSDSVSILKWQTVSTFVEEKPTFKDNNISLFGGN